MYILNAFLMFLHKRKKNAIMISLEFAVLTHKNSINYTNKYLSDRIVC